MDYAWKIIIRIIRSTRFEGESNSSDVGNEIGEKEEQKEDEIEIDWEEKRERNIERVREREVEWLIYIFRWETLSCSDVVDRSTNTLSIERFHMVSCSFWFFDVRRLANERCKTVRMMVYLYQSTTSAFDDAWRRICIYWE